MPKEMPDNPILTGTLEVREGEGTRVSLELPPGVPCVVEITRERIAHR